jgi:prevent-host-death family protein
MRTAKISELKAKLSAHIEFVKNGEEVLIFDRNTPVARLVPAGVVKDQENRRRQLIAKGILTPAKKPRQHGEDWPDPPGPMVPAEIVEQLWREEREGR